MVYIVTLARLASRVSSESSAARSAAANSFPYFENGFTSELLLDPSLLLPSALLPIICE